MKSDSDYKKKIFGARLGIMQLEMERDGSACVCNFAGGDIRPGEITDLSALELERLQKLLKGSLGYLGKAGEKLIWMGEKPKVTKPVGWDELVVITGSPEDELLLAKIGEPIFCYLGENEQGLSLRLFQSVPNFRIRILMNSYSPSVSLPNKWWKIRKVEGILDEYWHDFDGEEELISEWAFYGIFSFCPPKGIYVPPVNNIPDSFIWSGFSPWLTDEQNMEVYLSCKGSAQKMAEFQSEQEEQSKRFAAMQRVPNDGLIYRG